MLNNRRRASEAQHGWARIRANVSMLFILNPLAMVVPGFMLVGILIIGTNQLVSRPWPGACYETHLESRGQMGRPMPVCGKHIPFADRSSTTHSS